MASQLTTAPRAAVSSHGSARGAALRPLVRAYLAIAEKPLRACMVSALLPLIVRVLLLAWYPVPAPAVHDEFSYQLGGDTFASGHLSNPPHPLWRHFETFHVLQQPTYASKYPPMQALFLAAGQKLGEPWIGVLLSVAIMCGCLCWALQGWLSLRLAFAGALLALLRLGISSYWVNSYWGGAPAAIGGALVVGALPRLLRQPRRSLAFLFAIGLVILANSRPYEGILLAAPAIAVLIIASLRRRAALSLLRIAALPLLATLIPAALAMGYYNHRVTHRWFLMPYQLHEQQYAVAPSLLFQSPRKPPVYRHAIMKEFWEQWDPEYTRNAREHWVAGFKDHVDVAMLFFFGTLTLGLLTILLPHPKGNPADRLTFPILVVFLAGLLPEKDVPPHYWAPVVALLFVRFMNTVGSLWSWRPARLAAGPALAIAACLCTALLSVLLLKPMLALPSKNQFALQRQSVEARLNAMPGPHLVVVRYGPGHSIHQEWVYNRAGIDSSRIVWARDMGDEGNRDLLRYFAGRNIWLLEPDKTPLRLVPY